MSWRHTVYDARVLGSKVRKAREERGLTQDELANAAGMNRVYLGRVERGEVDVTLRILYDIAHQLACPALELVPLPGDRLPE